MPGHMPTQSGSLVATKEYSKKLERTKCENPCGIQALRQKMARDQILNPLQSQTAQDNIALDQGKNLMLFDTAHRTSFDQLLVEVGQTA